MTLKKRYLRTVHFLFIALLLVQLLPDKLTTDTYAGYVIWFAVGVEILTLIVSALIKKPLGLTLFVDIVSFIYGLLIAWTLATAKFNLLKPSAAHRRLRKNIHEHSQLGRHYFAGLPVGSCRCDHSRIAARFKRTTRQRRDLSCKVLRRDPADRIHSIRHRAAADLPFGIGFCHLSGDLLACAGRYHERRDER